MSKEKEVDEKERALREAHRLLLAWAKQLNHLDNGRRLVSPTVPGWIKQVNAIYDSPPSGRR